LVSTFADPFEDLRQHFSAESMLGVVGKLQRSKDSGLAVKSDTLGAKDSVW